MKLVFTLFVAIALVSCQPNNNTLPNNTANNNTHTKVHNTDVKTLAGTIVQLLKDKQYSNLVQYMQPKGQLLFSPYAYIDTATAQKFADSTLLRAANDTVAILNWGVYDGSGEAIQLSFNKYMAAFVYDKDYATVSAIQVDSLQAKGNTASNIKQVYPASSFVEYYVLGNKELDGKNWAALTLVFNKINNHYFLVAIVHNQWTI